MLLIQCDFDDTISVGNISKAIRNALAPNEWHQIEEAYLAGKHSVEESNIQQFKMVKTTEQKIRELVASTVVVREGFAKFIRHCLSHHVLPVVVSSGLDLYVKPTLEKLGLGMIESHSATTTITESGIEVEYYGPSGTIITRGFKESFLNQFIKLGHTVIYVGDGLSDKIPAIQADFIIARSTLASYLEKKKHPYYTFKNFYDVRNHVDTIRHSIDL